MKHFNLTRSLLSLSMFATFVAIALPASAGPYDHIFREEQQVDKALNLTYQRLLRQIQSGEVSLKKDQVVAMQRAWLAYRDALAHLEGAIYEGGTEQPRAVARKNTELTRQQIKHLERLMEGI